MSARWGNRAGRLGGWIRQTPERLWLRWLRARPRYASLNVRLFGHSLRVLDGPSFAAMYEEIFRREVYRFPLHRADPLILDCGANVGLSVLYFKRLAPASRVVAFEPDPRVCEVLEHNVRSCGLRGVTVVNRAVWDCETTLRFRSEGADAGRIEEGPGDPQTIEVKTERLRNRLGERIDLLKLDIEGAEGRVVRDCAGAFDAVERVFVEYHSFEDQSQDLDELIAVLRRAGYRLHVDSPASRRRPFCDHRGYLQMDLQLGLFGWRPGR